MTIALQTLNDGPRNHVIKAVLSASDETDTVVADYSAASGTFDGFRLDKIQWSFSGLSAILEWDATADVVAVNLHDGEGELDFSDVGGIQNNAGAGITQDLTVTTTGLGAGDFGVMTVWLKKK